MDFTMDFNMDFTIHDLWMPDVARWVDEKNQKLGERRPMMGFIKTV